MARTTRNIGRYPNWKLEDTIRFLKQGEAENTLIEEYESMYQIYNEHRPRARELFARMKSERGICSSIMEQDVFEWMNTRWTESEIVAEYYRKISSMRFQQTHANGLLVEMKQEIGMCDTVDQKTVLRWIEHGLTDAHIRRKYHWRMEQVRLVVRVHNVRDRIHRERGIGLDTSIKTLSSHFAAGATDDDVLEIYLATCADMEQQAERNV
ncbi:hypothetical protein BKA66DRAFT_569853 [Pyrenochaeta sp. MPI-SDFR-AT-0127]|nr:hypothetical protein BKA66DRAFT_569853 [Pyrenochaeta sp. MPI-SDFR-AT-0127]